MNLNKNKKDEFENLMNTNLNKFFLKDIYITLTSYKLSAPVTAVVIDYSDSILSIRFKDSSSAKNLVTGDPIVINIASKNKLYNASASVLQSFPTTMDLKIEKVTIKDDLRKEERFLVGLSGEVEYNNNTSFMIVKNISQNGLHFISKLDIPLNSEISVLVNTYELLQIRFIGKIVHKSTLIDNYSYGASIQNIDNKNQKNLDACIRNLINI